ncbi:MAG: nicotinamide mononucleotide transporter, partial [Alistipes sp.]|nr:nicotinamide mononucleotide transporter [Candidatus Alistipes equi]
MSHTQKWNANKILSWFLIIGMTIVTAVVTYIKMDDSDLNARMMILLAAFSSLMGIASTVSSANGKIVTFLFGVLDVSIYGVMCLVNWHNGSSGLGTGILHLVYFVPMQFVGFYQWKRQGKNHSGSVNAKRLDTKQRIHSFILFSVIVAISYLVICHFDRSVAKSFIRTAVILDVLPFACNIMGQLLMSFVYMEQWIFWLGVNIFSVLMWSYTLHTTEDATFSII